MQKQEQWSVERRSETHPTPYRLRRTRRYERAAAHTPEFCSLPPDLSSGARSLLGIGRPSPLRASCPHTHTHSHTLGERPSGGHWLRDGPRHASESLERPLWRRRRPTPHAAGQRCRCWCCALAAAGPAAPSSDAPLRSVHLHANAAVGRAAAAAGRRLRPAGGRRRRAAAPLGRRRRGQDGVAAGAAHRRFFQFRHRLRLRAAVLVAVEEQHDAARLQRRLRKIRQLVLLQHAPGQRYGTHHRLQRQRRRSVFFLAHCACVPLLTFDIRRRARVARVSGQLCVTRAPQYFIALFG